MASLGAFARQAEDLFLLLDAWGVPGGRATVPGRPRFGWCRTPLWDLVESIRRFPDQKRFAAMIGEAGFGQVGWTNYSGGVAALHTGRAI